MQDFSRFSKLVWSQPGYQTGMESLGFLHPNGFQPSLHANAGFSAAFSVVSKVEVAMPHRPEATCHVPNLGWGDDTFCESSTTEISGHTEISFLCSSSWRPSALNSFLKEEAI